MKRDGLHRTPRRCAFPVPVALMQPMSSHRTRFLHTPTRRFPGIALLAAGIMLLQGCDQIYERAGFPDPARIEAEGKAIGGACRHAGRGLEDCYRLNKDASKSAVYAGWKEMNEYMVKNNMQAVDPLHPAGKCVPGEKEKEAGRCRGELRGRFHRAEG
jgi:hypothetical protein